MNKLHFLIIGAHPDDCDLRAAGLALRMRKKGHDVTFLSATDGSAGHQEMEREALAARRLEETKAAGALLDVEYRVLPIPDAGLTTSLEHRHLLLKAIREVDPDVIITHRTCDYHPDHRCCGQLVMDCSYLIGVPLCCPDVPAMRKTPVILSMWDRFVNPVPFRADVCVPIDDVIEKKIDAVLCHVSQFYEWLPWVEGWKELEGVEDFEERTALLRLRQRTRFSRNAQQYADKLPEGTKYAEAFEWNEYGAKLTEELIREMTEA